MTSHYVILLIFGIFSYRRWVILKIFINESPTHNEQNEGLTNSLRSLVRQLFNFLVCDVTFTSYTGKWRGTVKFWRQKGELWFFGIINSGFIIVIGLDSKKVIFRLFLVFSGGGAIMAPPTYYRLHFTKVAPRSTGLIFCSGFVPKSC